ncbi:MULTISPECIES: sugar ABC transporter permease [unclassified Paenibacillus]|uniref:ABC transporter permease n=1 Tax=unclassified Paenibacillus TaxID=185978 RepID=UPI0027847730|nr:MULTISPECIES: sugar ABC transporter permease [unclassified Paenibacillus]MDQ0903557.1 putative aldouronate transport system permease protein [Paenibacillus sp. V4I7]MDQ0917965.1 putative aldouronate transport system permease protein [Paenibacillus sp. V4I5]
MQEVNAAQRVVARKQSSEMGRRIWKNKWIYVMLLPGVLYFLVFKYIPMYGLIISFQNYKPFKGISGSEWVGFEHFQRLFTEPDFLNILSNTLILFGMNLLFYFPVPILLALMLNEVKGDLFKKTFQTIVYLPHFMSWVIIVSISFVMLTMDGGIINDIIEYFGFEKINFLLAPEWFRPTYILQVIWREAGWGTIIYLAAIASIDPGLYEAARMDGAGRIRQMWHITLPAIRSVIIVLLILKIGDVLELGFEHVYLLLNSMNRNVAEIIDTYVYTAGLKQGQFSYSAAIGLFKSFIGLALVMIVNRIAKKMGEEGVY